MTIKLNELVERLTKELPVESSRPQKTAVALKECIDRNYVHIMFKQTETELGVQLYLPECDFKKANFENATGTVTLVGGLTLNYNKVKCKAVIDLATCEGKGCLEPLTDDAYQHIMGFAAVETPV